MATDSVHKHAVAFEPVVHLAPIEAWIVGAQRPAFDDRIGGLPHLFRIAGELALAGITQAYVLTREPPSPELLARMREDPRLAKIRVTIVAEPPMGPPSDAIVVVRGDRIWHRDIPKACVLTWTRSRARLAKVAGDEHDAIVITERAFARQLVTDPAALGSLAADEIVTAPAPYLAFTTAAPDGKALRRAERRLVWSLRKSADGIASKLINRHISLPLTWLLMRTRLLPNHVTIAALVTALVGAVVIGQGGYMAGAIGMLFVELGSIIDGVDGELARLKFQFSRAGQWLDTVVDDIANVCYSCGIMLNLHAAGVSWALPLWTAVTVAFVLTQSSQYWLISRVYHSGDLAAIPWAFQSTAFLSQRPRGILAWLTATAPKLLKRDTAVTVFAVFAVLGHLDWVLVCYSAGALVFFGVFFVQFARNFPAVRRALRGD